MNSATCPGTLGLGELNLKEALVLIDDLLVSAPTLEEHEQRLMKVLQRLKEFELKFSVETCVFFSNISSPWACRFQRWCEDRS